MTTKITQGFIDRSAERSSTHFYVADGVANDITQPLADADAVHDGMAVLTLCNFTDQNLITPVQVDTPIIPTSTFAQRELALWIQYVDDTNGDYGSMSIPGPAMTLLGQAGTDEVDIVANVTMAAFVVILEANCVSRDGNGIEVVRARIIGRSN